MGGKKMGQQGEKSYQIRPPFKDKFRPQEAKEKLEKVVKERLDGVKTFSEKDKGTYTKEIADLCKQEMRNLGKDKRYKFIVQCIMGQNYN